MFKTGDLVRYSTDSRPYSHMGFTDPGYIIPASSEVLRITRVTRRKNGEIRLTLRRRKDSPGGFSLILNSDWTTQYPWSRIEREDI